MALALAAAAVQSRLSMPTSRLCGPATQVQNRCPFFLVSLLIRLTPYLSRTLIALLCISSQTRLRTKNLPFLLRRRHWLLWSI